MLKFKASILYDYHYFIYCFVTSSDASMEPPIPKRQRRTPQKQTQVVVRQTADIQREQNDLSTHNAQGKFQC